MDVVDRPLAVESSSESVATALSDSVDDEDDFRCVNVLTISFWRTSEYQLSSFQLDHRQG